MPIRFGNSCRPVASAPMMFPRTTTWPAAVLESTVRPAMPLPEMTLPKPVPGVDVKPPIVYDPD